MTVMDWPQMNAENADDAVWLPESVGVLLTKNVHPVKRGDSRFQGGICVFSVHLRLLDTAHGPLRFAQG